MRYMTVKFLDKDYSIPEDVLTYIDLLDFAENVKQQLVNAFIRKLNAEIRKGNTACLDDNDLSAEIEQQVGRFIAKLCDNGIFNRTINDYLRNNKGYQLFSDVNKAALEKMKSLLIREMDSWQAGFEDALQKKESSVTGMGFSIWSSSFINHAIYAAMEASTVDKQEKAAAVQYQKDMNELRSRLDSQYSKEKSAYVHNTYIPNMEAALTVFAYELLDKYLADLIASNSFDGKTLEFVDIGRSNDLLKNLTLSNNKRAILENAFVACPYNIAVYMQAMKYDLLDYNSFQTAKVFKQSDIILSFLKNNWGEVSFPSKFHLDYHCIDLWALFTDTTPETILCTRTEQYANGIIKAYERIAEMLSREDLCRSAISGYTEDVILAGDAICASKAHSFVDTIVSVSIWNQLVEKCGHSDLLSRIKKNIPETVELITKDDIDRYLVENLTTRFEEARASLIPQIAERREKERRQRIIEEEQRIANEKEISKRKTRKTIAIIVAIPLAIISIILLMNLSSHMKQQQEEREAQQRIEEYCTFQLTIQEYSSEKACLSALQKLSSEYSELKKAIRDDWNSYGSEEEIHEELMLELDNNFVSAAEEIVSNCSVELDHSAAALVDAFQKHGWRIEYIGEKIAERDYAYAFDNYMDISSIYVEDATYYIINTLYPETFSKGIRERLLHVGVHAWGNTGRELLNSILSYIDSMPEGRAPFESDIATAKRQLSEKNKATGK